MSIDVLLSRFDKVKRKAKGQWVACCPAHEDRSPSMTIAETDDGRVLIHCFSGCSVEEILGSIGLGFDSLFPPKPQSNNPKRPISKPYLPAAVLEALAFEALLVVTAARQLANGEALDDNDYQRLLLAGRDDFPAQFAVLAAGPQIRAQFVGNAWVENGDARGAEALTCVGV